MKKSVLAAQVLHRFGGTRLLNMYWGRERLTVLAYHRITDVEAPGFHYYRPVVSATPAMFARQMAFIGERFNVIGLDDLVAFVAQEKPLPPRPLLITFDDGYMDNYTDAFPVLKQHGFPAVIFLMTSRMDDPAPPWWDEVAYYFHYTTLREADLPLIGAQAWTESASRLAVQSAMLWALKAVPETQKLAAILSLGNVLRVDPPPADPDLFVNWDQVRELVANGVACQPHTVTHPILTRVDLAEARRQIAESRDHILAKTDQAVTAFAYPNGGPADYNTEIADVLRDEGYKAAFTLEPGPMRYPDLHRRPLEIKRVYLDGGDTLDLFALKVMGLPAVVSNLPFA